MKINGIIPEVICVYKITNLKTNLILIGSTRNLHKRIIQYKYDILHQRTLNVNKNFLQDVLLYGLDNLNIDILEEFDKDITDVELKNKETDYIKKYNSIDCNIGYNIRLDFDGKYICNLSTKILKQEQLKEQWANGIRDGHANTMKNYWKNTSKERVHQQSEIMTKNLTKYTYNLYTIKNELIHENLTYKQIKAIIGVRFISSFAQKEKIMNRNNDTLIKKHCSKIKYCNKYIIERKFINKN